MGKAKEGRVTSDVTARGKNKKPVTFLQRQVGRARSQGEGNRSATPDKR